MLPCLSFGKKTVYNGLLLTCWVSCCDFWVDHLIETKELTFTVFSILSPKFAGRYNFVLQTIACVCLREN